MDDLSPRPIRIFIIDDHSLFRESVARLLAVETDFAVVGHCGSVEEALRVLPDSDVSIVLLDFDLGSRNGEDFMRSARQRGFQGKVLVVTAGVDDGEAASLIKSGVSGIFMKHNSAFSLTQGIRDVMAGKVSFDPDLLQGAVTGGARLRSDVPAARLSLRERDVLACVLEGLTNKEIAKRIGVSESSVKATLQQLFAKTGVRTRSQLVRIALEQYEELL